VLRAPSSGTRRLPLFNAQSNPALRFAAKKICDEGLIGSDLRPASIEALAGITAIASLYNNPEFENNPRFSVSLRTTFEAFTGNYTCFLPVLKLAPFPCAKFCDAELPAH